MAAQLLLPPPLPPQPSSGRFVRIEYLDFQNVAEHREFRLRAYLPDGSAEFRFRIAVAAFDAGRVRLQDGPDVCYQKVLRAVAAGETPSPDVISIDDLELASYRAAHTPVPKHRSYNPVVDADSGRRTAEAAADVVPAAPRRAAHHERRRAGPRGGPTSEPRGLRSRRDDLVERWSHRRSLRPGRTEDVHHVDARRGCAIRAPHVGNQPTRRQPALRVDNPASAVLEGSAAQAGGAETTRWPAGRGPATGASRLHGVGCPRPGRQRPVVGPGRDRVHHPGQGLALLRQLVLHPHRGLGDDRPGDDPLLLQLLESLAEHAIGDLGDGIPEGGEPAASSAAARR